MPTPNADRAKPSAPPMPRQGGGPPPPAGRTGGPPPPAARTAASPPSPPPTPALRGPVASPGGPAASTPFKATTNTGGGNPDEQRVQSNRVYAIVLGMFGLVCLVFLGQVFLPDGDDASKSKTSEVVATTSTKKSSRSKTVDTGGPTAPPPVTRRPARSTPARAPAKRSTAPSPGSAGRGTVIIKLPDSTQASAAELVCTAGAYRLRKPFSGGVASFSGVPGGACTVFFKGGIPAKFTPVTSGRSYTCNIMGITAVCR